MKKVNSLVKEGWWWKGKKDQKCSAEGRGVALFIKQNVIYRSFFFSRVICLSIGSAISRQPKGFDDAYEKIKVTCHENIPMSFYKPWSKILHKAAKGWRRSKMKAKWRIVTFLLSHCTVCAFPLFPPLFSQLLHQLLTWLKKMKKSLKFCWFWLKTSG